MGGGGGWLPSGECGRSRRRGFCSDRVSVLGEAVGLESRTIVHTPLRSCKVRSGGAAIVAGLGGWKEIRVWGARRNGLLLKEPELQSVNGWARLSLRE